MVKSNVYSIEPTPAGMFIKKGIAQGSRPQWSNFYHKFVSCGRANKNQHVAFGMPAVILRVYPGKGLFVIQKDHYAFVPFSSRFKESYSTVDVMTAYEASKAQYRTSFPMYYSYTVPQAVYMLGLTSRGTLAGIYNAGLEQAYIPNMVLADIPARFNDDLGMGSFKARRPSVKEGKVFVTELFGHNYRTNRPFFVKSSVFNITASSPVDLVMLQVPGGVDTINKDSSLGTADNPYNLDSVGWVVR